MEEKYLDETINPGDDFFKYATGHWIDYNKQPAEYPRWSAFAVLNEDNLKRINKIIQHPGKSELGKKINQYYKILMNWNKRNHDALNPLKSYLYKNIYSLFNKEEIFNYCAKEHHNIFWSIAVFEDIKNSSMNTLYINQDGLSLDNKEYYLSNDEDKKKVVKAFKKYVIDLYKLIGKTEEEAEAKYKVIWDIETQIAKVSYSIEELQEPSINYHKKNIQKLSETLEFDFNKYLNIYGYDQSCEIIVGQEKPIKLACKLFNELDIEDLKTMLEWQIINNSVGCLNDDIYKIYFKFSKSLSGAKKMMPKRKRAINTCNSLFGEAIGQIYCKKYFSEEAKHDVEDLIHQMIISYKNILTEQQWMSDETKHLAIEKLNSLKLKIGYPDKIEDYSDIPVDSELTLFENRINIGKYLFEKNKEKRYNKPVDKDEWLMNPQDVNAYYNPTSNEICFPAGILQAPFYDLSKKQEENFGGIGVVIGHEMTHGYDNHGRQFDKDGNMKMWWKEDEIEKFNELTQNTIKRFNNIDVLPDLKGNGTLTLGENLADYGGLKISFNACANTLGDDKDWMKRFFLSYAQVWSGVNTEEGIRTQTLNNEHSINYIRVNGTLPMFDPWYYAFDIQEAHKLYVNPEDRAKIW